MESQQIHNDRNRNAAMTVTNRDRHREKERERDTERSREDLTFDPDDDQSTTPRHISAATDVTKVDRGARDQTPLRERDATHTEHH